MTHDEFKKALKTLGFTYCIAAKRLHMDSKWGWQTVGRWARGELPVPGPVQAAIELMLQEEQDKRHG